MTSFSIVTHAFITEYATTGNFKFLIYLLKIVGSYKYYICMHIFTKLFNIFVFIVLQWFIRVYFKCTCMYKQYQQCYTYGLWVMAE